MIDDIFCFSPQHKYIIHNILVHQYPEIVVYTGIYTSLYDEYENRKHLKRKGCKPDIE